MDEGGLTEGFTTQLATTQHWRLMLVVVALATLGTVAALYAPGLQLPELPQVLPIYGTCITITDLLTSYLLFNQFGQLRRKPMALLGSIYLYSGLIVWPQLLCFPGVASATGLFGAGPQSAVWLWVFWHIGFLLFMAWFIFGEGLDDVAPLEERAAARLRASAVIVPFVVVVLLTVLATRGQNFLPDLLRPVTDGTVTTWSHYEWRGRSAYSATVIMFGAAIAISIPVITRCRRVIDLGIAVAVYAMLLDTVLNALSGTRFSLGWYVARANAILSSCAVLAVYLHEATRLYLKVMEMNRVLEARTVDLESSRDGAEAADRSKSAFLATMSHEIRTPINAILGLASLLEDTGLEGERRDFVGKIGVAGRSLLSIINDVLDFSRVESGRLELDQAPFVLSAVLDALNVMMTATIGRRDIGLMIAVDPSVPARIVGDAHRLQQILINLAGNALKFTEEGEVVLRVTVEGQASNRILLRFAVSDTGIGIPAAKLPELFDAFAQADSSTTRRYGGSGLGLTIAKRLVELMGGKIGVESVEGRGSTFWFVVPFAPALGMPVSAVAHGDGDLRSELSNRTKGLVGVRVLLVEDSVMTQDITRRILERQGATVTAVGDGQQAIVRLQAGAEQFDAVLMDVQMPVMDGYETTRFIRQTLGLATIPIIALTAGVLTSERERAFGAGMTDFLGKPAGMADMVKVIRSHIA
jgi:signal transduction histidine kinase